MVRTKQTPRGGASHRPAGMTTATLTGMGRGKADPEEQLRDALEEDTEEDLPVSAGKMLCSSQRKVNKVQVSPRVKS